MSSGPITSPMPATATHKCGRCRREFPLGAPSDLLTDAHWWLCPLCRERLLGDMAVVDARWA